VRQRRSPGSVDLRPPVAGRIAQFNFANRIS